MLVALLLTLLIPSIPLTNAIDLKGYEYIVVGSGAGGSPLAARLALAGHRTLLLEAGSDQGHNLNYSVPGYAAKVTEDPALAWNFFVRHYTNDTRQARDFKTVYETPDGKEYTGLQPPAGSRMKGILYPRAGTLGGCTAHNALVAMYPFRSDFDDIARVTGDGSWAAENMRRYFVRLERNRYVLPGDPRHGYWGWLGVEKPPLRLVLQDEQLLSLAFGGAFALEGNSLWGNLASLIVGDANAARETRDTRPGYYALPVSVHDGKRNGPREFVVSVRDAVNADGSKRYPLDVRTDCFVTRIVLDKSVGVPRATGVEFLDGEFLYKASPLSRMGRVGVPGTATASREVIVAGGAYNSPQLLKLSGIGPARELQRHGIEVVVDRPGVGSNLQDQYEVMVQGHLPKDLGSLKDCTFDFPGQSDPCLARWMKPVLGDRGIYASSGLSAAMFYRSTAASSDETDIVVYSAIGNFRGYFPGYSVNITATHDWFTWSALAAHPRNNAGTVTLRSADPLDPPEIVFNYFDTGVGNYTADLQGLYEAIQLGRKAFARQRLPVTEVLPGKQVLSPDDIETYIRDTAWGHHATSTCSIGPDDDPMAVLDSKFRVRGVHGLRVVDASVFPRTPGTFPTLAICTVAEKAADVILSEIVNPGLR
ncbi:hypothetical protein BDV28DRAFT_162326 [Aspergillus coremiiformis]|uniref:Glucose-methanol-choline oxidoreductase N-terminal domain-containing protein n=1 Tax=Aspergillus coremiiformis TaxID=138285 RepID=A0A5N6ZIG4_9EURO|nr:hypothetical protein BDV28DRAFT_162326 [Aspergillus coremiiformis]